MKHLPIILLLAGCSTSAKVSHDGDSVKAGYGNRVLVTFKPDGTKTVQVEPISMLEAVLSGTAGGLMRALIQSSNQPPPK